MMVMMMDAMLLLLLLLLLMMMMMLRRSAGRLLLVAVGRERRCWRPGNLRLPLVLRTLRLAGRHASHAGRGSRRLTIRGEHLTVVDESRHCLGAKWIAELMGVDGEVGLRVTADGVQDSVGILGDDLHVAVEQHPVAWLWPVGVAQRMPALVCLGIHLAALAGGFWSSRALRFDRPSQIAVAFACSQKTLPVALVLFDYFKERYPLAVVPMVLYHLGQLFVDTFIADGLAGRPLREAELPPEAVL